MVGLNNPIFVAVVVEAPPLVDRSGAYQAFDMHGEWQMKIIMVQYLQTLVGLMKENSANRRANDGWCAVLRGHVMQTAPFLEIPEWF